jgi:serine phosphatase RsbU (regulator of sigma subunit)
MFATIIFGLLQPSTGEMRYVNAGHNSPLLIKNNIITRELRPTGPAVGLSGDHVFSQESITIEPSEMLFMYTDGVTEAQTPKGDFFTVERLKKLLVKKYGPAEEKVLQIKQALEEHNGDAAPYDDTTILAVKRKTL